MTWLRNMKVANKIFSLIILAALFLSGTGYIGYYYMNDLEVKGNQMYDVDEVRDWTASVI